MTYLAHHPSFLVEMIVHIVIRIKCAKAAGLLCSVNNKWPQEVTACGIAAESEGQTQLADLPTVSTFFAEGSAWSNLPIEASLVHVVDVILCKSLRGIHLPFYVLTNI